MADKIIKLQIPAGKATPAPPVGTALGPHGLNIQDFCSQFNALTADKGDTIIPVVLTVKEDKSFKIVLKSPPAAILIKQAIGLKKGSPKSHIDKVGKISQSQLKKIAKEKMEDLNANSIEQAMLIIAGTARSMGVEVSS
jgi:large subunit ribosomal protein L11